MAGSKLDIRRLNKPLGRRRVDQHDDGVNVGGRRCVLHSAHIQGSLGRCRGRRRPLVDQYRKEAQMDDGCDDGADDRGQNI
jgi:hypothetical protein